MRWTGITCLSDGKKMGLRAHDMYMYIPQTGHKRERTVGRESSELEDVSETWRRTKDSPDEEGGWGEETEWERMCVKWSIRECRDAVQSAGAGAGPRLFSMQAMRRPSSAWATHSRHDSLLHSCSPLNPCRTWNSVCATKHRIKKSSSSWRYSRIDDIMKSSSITAMKTTRELSFYSGDRKHPWSRTSPHPWPPNAISAWEKKKKRFRTISHSLTAESVGLPSPPRQQRERDSSGVQAMLPLICLQSHESSRNTRWMKGEHVNAGAEGIAGEGADSAKVSKWIPLRHLREQWGAFLTFFLWFRANFLPICSLWISKLLSWTTFQPINVFAEARPDWNWYGKWTWKSKTFLLEG